MRSRGDELRKRGQNSDPQLYSGKDERSGRRRAGEQLPPEPVSRVAIMRALSDEVLRYGNSGGPKGFAVPTGSLPRRPHVIGPGHKSDPPVPLSEQIRDRFSHSGGVVASTALKLVPFTSRSSSTTGTSSRCRARASPGAFPTRARESRRRRAACEERRCSPSQGPVLRVSS